MDNGEIERAMRQAKRSVPWRDLAAMTPAEGLVECLHPLGWLLGAWAVTTTAWWPLAIPLSFVFFLAALRLNHEAIHYNLGFGARGHRLVLHALSLVMLGSNHAIAWNHLIHHRHIGSERDHEGRAGRMTWREVLAYGPRFPLDNHREAWINGGTATRRKLAIDLSLNAAIPFAALASGAFFLWLHIALMLVAQCMTAFFAVWITHHGCDESGVIARTQRSRLVNFVSYNMFFHLEHHLFPGVPVKRLPRLAARLDAAFPAIAAAAGRVVPGVDSRKVAPKATHD